MSEEYAYAVARVHAREISLLSRSDLEQLLSCPDEAACLRMLADKGIGDGSPVSSGELFQSEQQKTWDFLHELVGNTDVLDVFRLPSDYHNLKAVLKGTVSGQDYHHLLRKDSTVPWNRLEEAVEKKDFSDLPSRLRNAAEEAYGVLLRTRDGQLCDLILDRACLEHVLAAAKESKDPLLAQYGELTAALADLKIAVRCARLRKGKAFLLQALAPCETLDTDALAEAASKGIEPLESYLRMTSYSKAAEALAGSPSQMELWCSNRIMELVQEQKSNPFTIGPLAAYWLARQQELSAVRMILSGKRNSLSDRWIRERLGEQYG